MEIAICLSLLLEHIGYDSLTKVVFSGVGTPLKLTMTTTIFAEITDHQSINQNFF